MRSPAGRAGARARGLWALLFVALSACAAVHDWGLLGTDGGARDGGCVDRCGGECVDLASDVAHCGACDVDCRALTNVLPGASGVRCLAGRCAIPADACAPGFADCVGSSDGCETDLALPSSCGGCANHCEMARPLCDSSTGTCTDVCPGGRRLCGVTCVDTTSDPRNCSDCGLGCEAIAGSAPTCVESVCSYECLPGRHDCGTVCGLDTSPLTCGTSCFPCPTRANAAALCPAGACESACLPGFHDCGGVCVPDDDTLSCGTSCTACPAAPGAMSTCDGASCGVACPAGAHACGEACLPDTDPASCGAACGPCPTPPNTRASCDGTDCATACRETHADCDGSGDGGDADGCEADLSDPLHCGSCAGACAASTPLCAAGGGRFACVAACGGGQTACGAACVSLLSNVQHCGACGVVCPAPTNGEPTCGGGRCGVVCDPGYHACGDGCVADTSPDGCGTACTPCPAPLHATATCDGRSCRWECAPGTHACGSVCAEDRDLATCGTSCTPCPTPANGTPTCSGSGCGFVCDAGFHACGGACAANASAATCGASCAPCVAPTNGVATCDGTRCDFACVAGHHRCGDACVADAAPASCGAACSPCAPPPNADATCDGTGCGFLCRAGSHRCGDVCVANASLASCGASCTPCAAPANAVATCDGAACGFSCSAGFADCDGAASNGCEADLAAAATCGACGRACAGAAPVCASGACASGCGAPTPTSCGGACVDTTLDPAHCGACGTRCASPPSASASCTAGVCGFHCDPGYHACGGACASNDSPLSCGASCAACPAPPGATATCAAGACGFVCNVGFNRCGGACVAEDSVAQCGTSCAACAAPPSGVPTCAGGACDFVCVSGSHRCGDGCASNASTGSCGARCVPCIAPANAASTCDGAACDFACNPGYLRVGAGCVPIAAPRPVAPLSPSHLTSLSPALRWVLAAGSDGARVEVCADRACAMVARTIDVAGSSVTVAPALTPGVWFWRLTGRVGGNTGVLTSPVWELAVTRRSTPRSTAWGALVDVDGDGFADAVIGAPRSAAAYAHRGGTAGLASTASGTLTGAASFGQSVSAAGDVDGDGFGDVVVGAPSVQTALVFYGSPTGLGARAPTAIVGPVSTYGADVAAAGDVDGDGYGDLLVGTSSAGRAYVHRGSASGVEPTAAWVLVGASATFGAAVASAGDVDADGFADLLVGDRERGEVRVYHGAAAGLGVTPTAARTLTGASRFGESVACAGDVNGDGFTDVVVAESGHEHAHVYLGSAAGLSATSVTLRASGAETDLVVAPAGDVDGDGYDDVLLGSDDARRAWLFRGASAGVTVAASATFTPPSSADTTHFGATVSSPGDLDGDGLADVLVGASALVSVYGYLGVLAAGPATTPSFTLVGPGGSGYGRALARLVVERRPVPWGLSTLARAGKP